MKLFLDTAEFDEIKQGVDWGVVVGVTTNPTLIAKAGQDHETQVKRICGIVGNVSAEVVSDKKDDILVEGRRLAAGRILAGDGIRINVTLCFSVNQALLAAAIGAYIISPFVGRIDDINEDGMQIVRDIVSAYRQQDITTQVLAASLRGPLHVSQAALAGADIGTMPFSVLQSMFKHPLTDAGLKRFKEDYLKSQEAKPARQSANEGSTASAAASGAARPSDERSADRLWAEHEALAPQLARLETMADAIGGEQLPLETLRSELDRAYDLLAGKVLPHIRTRDDFDKELVRHDYVHAEIHPSHRDAERLVSELGALRARMTRGETEGAPRETRRILYELHALLSPHFADEPQQKRRSHAEV
jgi:transaldolase